MFDEMPARITVFIVDGDESNQRALARLMKASKIRSYCASSVDELLELELPTSDAVIIADVSTIRRFAHSFPMQLHDGERSLPVIYLTQYDTERMRDEARQVGAAGYFRKPIDEQALIDAITFAVQ